MALLVTKNKKNKRSFNTVLICVLLALLTIQIFYNLNTSVIVGTFELSLNNKGERIYDGELFSGEAQSFYANGKLASSEQFKNGRRDGFTRKWFSNGVLSFESFHIEGLREGFVRSWWFNTIPRSQMKFVNGKAHGVAWNWYRNGKKFKKFNFINGTPQGMQQAWLENGKLFSNFEYKNGRIYGLRKANNCIGLENEVLSAGYYEKQSTGERNEYSHTDS